MTREEAQRQIAEVLAQLPPSESHNVLVDVIQSTNAASEANERIEFEQRRARIMADRRAARQALGG